MSKRYHINGQQEVHPCNAVVRPCKFGGNEVHFATRAAATVVAEKQIAKHFAEITKTLKKNPPRQQGFCLEDDLSSLTSAERAEVMVFEAMKKSDEIAFGSPDPNDYYGSGVPFIKSEVQEKLRALGVPMNKPGGYYSYYMNMPAIEEAGFKMRIILGTLKDQNTYHFNGTFASEENMIQHLNAEAIITNPQGVSLEIPITCRSNFLDLLSGALYNAKSLEEKVDILEAKDHYRR